MTISQFRATVRARADKAKKDAANALETTGPNSRAFFFESGRRSAYEDVLEMLDTLFLEG